MRFHHLGIACNSIEECRAYIAPILNVVNESKIIYDPMQDARLCMLQLSDGTKLELIEGPPVERLVRKGTYLYHTCYECDDIQADIDYLERNGSIIVSDLKEAILFGGRRVIFLSSKLGLIELLEA